ncbi:hypothetical protein CR513_45824, partial [Mucuna pruriens]
GLRRFAHGVEFRIETLRSVFGVEGCHTTHIILHLDHSNLDLEKPEFMSNDGTLSINKYVETYKASVTNSIPNGVVSLQMTKDNVLNEEMRRKTQEKGEQRKKKGKSKEKKHDDNDDHATTTTGDDFTESINLVSDENMWIIDSGATLHVTLRKEFCTSYTSRDFGVLKMGNDGVSKVIGVGVVCLQTNMRVYLWLKGVKHAPNVRFNLIFMHMLDDGGYDNYFGYGKWKLIQGNLVVVREEKISKLYWTKALVSKDSVNTMDMEASLWHRRLSHISEKG